MWNSSCAFDFDKETWFYTEGQEQLTHLKGVTLSQQTQDFDYKNYEKLKRIK